ncbi:MAG: hypothetical protein K6E63_00555 [Lachnospiraceae bacterium]|nr:hypothetical protein [Lachnospiraceae bacterium]
MMNKKAVFACLTVYVLSLIILLYYFNGKRGAEHEYSYDFSNFSVDAGCIDDSGSLFIDESSGYSGVFSATPGTQLLSGDYTLTVNYHSSGTNELHYAGNSNCDKYVSLPEGSSEITEYFSLWPASDKFRIWLIYKGSGDLRIDSIKISSGRPLYTDYEYYMILTVILGTLIPLFVLYFYRKLHFDKEQWTAAGIMAALSVIVSFPVFYDYIWQGVDTRPHLMRVDGVSTAISARRLPTIIYDNYCNDYGELSCIYPDKFLYLPALLRKFGVSLIASQGTMLFIINAAAILIMYFSAKYFTKSVRASLAAAIVYCFVPYRIYVMYSGGQAFGMGISMLFFMPVFVGLYDVFFEKGRKWYLLTFGMAGFLCSHILSFVLSIVIVFGTALFCVIVLLAKRSFKNDIQRIFVSLIKSVGLFVIVGLSTIVPFVYYQHKGINISKMSLDFLKCIHSLYDDFAFENGYYNIMLFVICLIMLFVYKRRKGSADGEKGGYLYIYSRYLIVLGFVLFVMSTKLFPWKIIRSFPRIYSMLNMFQFAERFRLAGMPAMCLGMAVLYKSISQDAKRHFAYITAAIMIVCVYLGLHTAYYQIDFCDVCVFDRMTGNIYYRQLGYLPPGTDMSYYESNVPNCGDWDSVENISYIKNGTDIHYEYKCSSDGNYIEFPLFKYAGYHAYDAAGNELIINNSEHNRILIDLVRSDEPQVIDIVFKMHPVFIVCAVISVLGTLFLLYIVKMDFSR